MNEVGHFMEVDGFVGIAPIIDDIIDTPGQPGAASTEPGRNHRAEDGGHRGIIHPARFLLILYTAIWNVT